jgi:ATP-binding cassette subfamily F protein 3
LVFELRKAVKRFGEKTVYDGVDLTIERGSKIALVGPNGSGKSTMMKILAAIEPVDGGERIVGHNVSFGYFAQDLGEGLDYSKNVLNELGDNAEGMTTTEIRGLLGAMLFSGDEVMKRTGVLSGGERARLALAKVLAHRHNCLLLDEPTNNLDIVAKDTLLEALERFQGTVVIVSHDRYLLNQLAKEVIEVGQGSATRYLGNYDDYLAKKEAEAAGAASERGVARVVSAATSRREPEKGGASSARGDDDGTNRNGYRGKPQGPRIPPNSKPASMTPGEHKLRPNPNLNARKREQIEAQIEQKEGERSRITAEMSDPDFYLRRKDASELFARYETLAGEIERLYGELLTLDGSTARATN